MTCPRAKGGPDLIIPNLHNNTRYQPMNAKMLLLTFATLTILATAGAVDRTPTLDELVQSEADGMYADRGKWHGSNLTPGVGMRRDPVTNAYYDWDGYVNHLYAVAHWEMDLIVSRCEVERALAQAAYDRGLLRKPRTCNRPCHEQVWRDHGASTMPHWGAIGAEKPVSDADHEWHWDIDDTVVAGVAAVLFAALLGVASACLSCLYILASDVIAGVTPHVACVVLFTVTVMYCVPGTLQSNIAVGGTVTCMCITYWYLESLMDTI